MGARGYDEIFMVDCVCWCARQCLCERLERRPSLLVADAVDQAAAEDHSHELQSNEIYRLINTHPKILAQSSVPAKESQSPTSMPATARMK